MLTTYLVDSLDDFIPPDDVSTIPADGRLTLREALLAASLDMAVGDAEKGTLLDEIYFAPALTAEESATIQLAGTSLQIAGDAGEIHIVGPGADWLSIDAAGASRVITHVSGAAHLIGLTIRGGNADRGGGIEHQGGSLTLESLHIENNFAAEGGGLASLGGTVTFIDCRIEFNYAELGGGVSNRAGGSSDAPSMIVERTTIAQNSAVYAEQAQGGGIYNLDSFLVIRDTTVEGNRADVAETADGGGIYNESNAGGGVLVERTTISGNFAMSRGGGIFSIGAELVADTRLRISNSTISGNNAFEEGGAIFNGSDSNLSIVDSTIVYNTCYAGSGVWNQSGLLELSNSIITGNDAAFDFRNEPAIDESQPPPVFNLIGNAMGYNDWRLMDQPENHNRTNVLAETLIGELADNGGPTATHALIGSSDNPAIDQGSSPILIDQRGRPINNLRDIGAFEWQTGESQGTDPPWDDPEETTVITSSWSSNVRAASQWGPVPGVRFGVGFDIPGDSSIQKEPEFLGFQFDTGPLVMGKIKRSVFGRFGAEVRLDMAGRFGLEYGYYVDSGTLDVNYEGLLAYTTTTIPGGVRLDTAWNVTSGTLHTISPRVGAYADLVLELDATVAATGCFVGCYGLSFPISFDKKVPLFSINRQDENGEFDGQIKFGSDPLQKKNVTPKDEVDPGKDSDLRMDWISAAGSFNREEDRKLREQLQAATDDSATRQQLLDSIRRQAAVDKARAQRELERAKTDEQKSAARAKIAAAEDRDAKAKKLQTVSDKRVKNLMKGGKLGGGQFLQFHLGQAAPEDKLLGAELTVSAGLGVDGVGSISKKLGTVALTLPDIQLTDEDLDEHGVLAASTKDFAAGSTADDKRQLAKVSVDVGGLLGPLIGIPAGEYSVSFGPLGLRVTTVSYNIVPRLSVNQTVQVDPYVKTASLNFGNEVSGKINGEPFQGTNVSFTPGDSIEIFSNDEVTVTPKLHIGNRFTNDLGLDVDLRGMFEAFAVQLSIFGKTLLNLGPLLQHTMTFGAFDLGSIFNRTFDLPTQEQTLESFTIGGSQPAPAGFAVNPLLVTPQPGTGGDASGWSNEPGSEGESGTSDDPLVAGPSVTFTPNQVQAVDDPLVFVAVPLLDVGDGTLYTEMEISIAGNTLKSIGVFRDGAEYQPLLPAGNTVELERGVLLGADAGTTRFRLADFDITDLSARPTVLLGLKFDQAAEETTVTVTRTSPVSSPLLTEGDERLPAIEDRGPVIHRDQVEQANAAAVLRDNAMDITGDGQQDALSDGMLVLRFLSGLRGAPLVAGIDLSRGTRATAVEIESYLEELAEQGRLDPDGDGQLSAEHDGILILRQQFGFTDSVLVAGALGENSTRVTGREISDFVVGKRISADGDGFDIPEILDRTGGDPLGLRNVNRIDPDAMQGSSAWVPLPATVEDGNSRQFALHAAYNQNVEFTPVLCNGEPVADTAHGSPRSGLVVDPNVDFVDSNTDLDEQAIEAAFSLGQPTLKALGIEAPLFLDVPDAAAYTYHVENGFRFDTLTIDLTAGDGVLIEPRMDLFLPSSGVWLEIDLSQPFKLPEGTTTFQLYSRPYRNLTMHRSTNQRGPDGAPADELQPAVVDVRVPIGFTFAGGDSGKVPLVTLETVPRQKVYGPPAVSVPEDSLLPAHVFTLRRRGADAELLLDGVLQQTVQIASATHVEATGTGTSADIFVIDTSDGPLDMLPIVFRGSKDDVAGDWNDLLRVDGSGVDIELYRNVTLIGVESIDIRGTGDNSIDVPPTAVFDNLGGMGIFYVLLDPGHDAHNIDAAHAWAFESEVVWHGGVYGQYAYTQRDQEETILWTVRAAVYRREAPPPSGRMALYAAFDDGDLLSDDTVPDELVQQLSIAREKGVRNHLPGTGPPGALHKWFLTPFSRTVLKWGGEGRVKP